MGSWTEIADLNTENVYGYRLCGIFMKGLPLLSGLNDIRMKKSETRKSADCRFQIIIIQETTKPVE